MALHNVGISLSGGGARGSYQAGVLRGLAEILDEQNMTGQDNPLQYWSGVSAGSINASFCSAGLHNFSEAAEGLVKIWSNIKPEEVYKTDLISLSRNSVRWVRDLTFGSLLGRKLARSLLDTEPFWTLINNNIAFADIEKNLSSGLLKGLACSAYSYLDNRTVTFLQSTDDISWSRHRRYSKKVNLTTEHILASCAIPVLFPAVKIQNEYFADGSFRNLSPISPLLYMGAKKLLVIGVQGETDFSQKEYSEEPGLARISGAILNSLFFDTLDIDLKRVANINEKVLSAKADIVTERSSYSYIDLTIIRPSVDVSLLASQKAKNFPKLIDFLLGGLGSPEESAELASYILFVSEFTKDLIELGYNDAMKQKQPLIQWLQE